MATTAQPGQLGAGNGWQQQHDDSQGSISAQEGGRQLSSGRLVRAAPHQPSKAPPTLRPANLLARPGMGRQMSSVSNLIDAYARNSPSTSTGVWSGTSSSDKRHSTSNSSSAPNSPSFAQSEFHSRQVYHSQIIARRSSVQVPGSPRASTSELSPLVRERRPSAPEIHSPPTRVTSGAYGVEANAAKAPGTMSSTFDIKRLRSKPAPLQHSLSSGQSSSGNIRDGSGSMETLRPGDQHLVATNSRQQQESSLTTMLPDSLAMLQTSASPASCSLAKAENSNSVVASKQGGSQAGPSVSSLYNQGQQQFSSQNNSDQHNTRSDETAAWPPRNQSQRSESDSLGVLRHVNSGTSSTVTEAQQPAIHAGFDSLIHYGGANQQHIASVSSLTLESPQTPRKVRNSSLPMGTSPSVSSSPDAGRQSPPSRRPTNATAYTVFSTASSPYNHSLPLLPNQPPLPPSPRIKASVDGVMYESILPTSSSLRPIRQTSSEGMLISSPISSPSETIASPEAALSSVHDSSTGAKKERIPSNASSPTTHKKLVRKQSKGHIRRDSGTSGHIQTPSSSSAVHSRSLSLPRSSSRGSTPNGSGSGSEHDETTVATSLNQSHFLTHRPAWLDQDPNATSPPPPPSRGKAGHHYPSLYQQHNNRSLTSLSQEQLHISSQDQSFFAPFSLPSTSAFPAQTEPGTSAPPKRKASFYRRKRSQTATGIQGDQVSDSNGFPMPSPMSEIVKSMPLHDRMSHDVLHAPAPAPKRSTGAGGFLSSITRKLSHPNLKDPPHSSEISSVLAHSTSNYFGLAYAAVSTERNDTSDQRTSQSTDDSPKLASSHAPRSWRNPFQHNNQSKSEATAPSQLSAFQSVPSKEVTHSDPFSVSSTISLPGFLHRSPRKDSLSSDRSDHSNGQKRGTSRSRTISQDGDSSDGHSSEAGFSSLRAYDLAPPVPELPFGMRSAKAGSPAASTLPKSTRKTPGLLRSPSIGHRSKKALPDLDLSPTTPRASVFNTNSNDDLPSPTRAGSLIIDKANESLISARRSGLSATLATLSATSETPAPNVLGSFAARDKIKSIENDLKEARFLALMERSARAEHGVIKLSLASSEAKEAGIA